MGMTEPEQLNMHHRNVSNFNKKVVKSNLAVTWKAKSEERHCRVYPEGRGGRS